MTCGLNSTDAVVNWNIQALKILNSISDELTIDSLSKQAEWFRSAIGFQRSDNKDLQNIANINTPNMARDLDLIRSLMGYPTLNYISFDAVGSENIVCLMFLERVGRIVIDGIHICCSKHPMSFKVW